MFCSKCGVEIPDDSKYCYKCGKKIAEESLTRVKSIAENIEHNEDKNNVFREDRDSAKIIKSPEKGFLFSKNYWLTWEGRRNRKPYFFVGLLLNFVLRILLLAFDPIMQKSLLLALGLLLLVLFIAYLGIINLGKRLHDIDINAWYGAIFNIMVLGWSLFSPESPILLLFSVVVGIGVLLVPGTAGANRYGENPLDK
ncbi:DUF805 domain-containing protein [uncultured Phascolarctobacterium sp.]|uniref:DUF805 domain-containing protein n=2 Tax=Phascolarctobacterium TaxID=33024 RepID=UPI0025D7A981|nr:DUF805 domain-containing protein [uncultured Phascolarctobacterium sp.]